MLQRGNNRQPVFLAPDDYLHYLDSLRMAAREHDVAIHAYGLRPNISTSWPRRAGRIRSA